MRRRTNVTIKVHPDVLLVARLRALQYGTSVNAVLAQALEDLARRPRPTPEPGDAPSVPVTAMLLARFEEDEGRPAARRQPGCG